MEIRLKKNVNGKLLCDSFSLVALHDEEYQVGKIVNIIYSGMSAGTAKVVAVRRITFSQISDLLSYPDSNVPAVMMAGVLRTQSPNGINGDTLFSHIVLQWEVRDRETTQHLFKSKFEEIQGILIEA